MSSPPDTTHRPLPGPPAARDKAVWTRVNGIRGASLDLLTARIGRRHYAPHTHAEYAIGVCTDGLEVIQYRGGRLYAGPGALVVLEPGETHTGGPAGTEGFAYRVLYPAADLVSEDARRPGTLPRFPTPVIQDAQLARELGLAHRALTRPRALDVLEAESRLLWVLGTLVHRHAVFSPDRGTPSAGRDIAQTVAQRLADELTNPPTLAELAAEMGMSRYRLLRAFRDATGMPPYAWLAQYRVSRARALLDAGHRPAQAAAHVGFADQAHLTRWFRRVMGVTPGAYRNSVQDGIVRIAPS
ncbi:AraC family transcriptional regulator [Actinomadura sp. NPDC047616]|uniref:helix-turn-helix transcriptional regulator n=1 Tax=Actinomadura sp. NPDC047616 TaxID=3155914 RepID=UPI0033D73315